MTSFPYWPETLPGPAPGLDYSPQDVRVSFEPDVGEPISRPKTTGAPYIINPVWTLQGAQIDRFTEFHSKTLARGSLQFCMRDPVNDVPRLCRFVGGAYKRQFITRTLARVSAQVMILPGPPWFAPYVPQGVSRVPDFVADYAGSVFGIEGKTVAASAIAALAGTYLVERTTTSAVTTAQEVLEAGDIPATAPANTTRIIGFAT